MWFDIIVICRCIKFEVGSSWEPAEDGRCALLVFSERELTFAIMSSAVRLSVCLSVCLSVTFVRPTQAIEIFGNVSTPFGTLAIC